MSNHQLYGYSFEIPDVFAEGHPLSRLEAIALNQLRGERITHMMRSDMTCAKGDTISEGDENHAVIVKHLAETAPTYTFTERGTGAPRRSPVDQEALEIARRMVKEKVAESGLKVGKRAKDDIPEETGDGIYPYSDYAAKVEEVAKMEIVRKEAKAIVAKREKAGGSDAFSL